MYLLFQREGSYGFVEFHKRFDYSNLMLRDELQDQLISQYQLITHRITTYLYQILADGCTV